MKKLVVFLFVLCTLPIIAMECDNKLPVTALFFELGFVRNFSSPHELKTLWEVHAQKINKSKDFFLSFKQPGKDFATIIQQSADSIIKKNHNIDATKKKLITKELTKNGTTTFLASSLALGVAGVGLYNYSFLDIYRMLVPIVTTGKIFIPLAALMGIEGIRRLGQGVLKGKNRYDEHMIIKSVTTNMHGIAEILNKGVTAETIIPVFNN